MNEKSFLVLLGDGATDRYRLSCQIERGQVIVFLVQYEAFIDDTWHPHRDLLRPGRAEEKTEFRNRSNAEVLTLGQEDIKKNWRLYRERFVQELKR
jgi:hypothetical protein